MKIHKRYLDIIAENEYLGEDNYIDKDLEDIRYYRGSIVQFKDYWEKKMKQSINPHGKVEYKYPKERTEDDKSLPYQDFINGESPLVKYNLKTRRKGGDNVIINKDK
jgi:hypothetical protein